MAATKNNKSTKMAEKVLKQRKNAAELAKESEIPTLQGQTETVTIRPEGSSPYELTLRFPGVAQAWRVLESDTKDSVGNIVGPAVLENALNAGIIVYPKINSIDFWNVHRGFYESAAEVVKFLTARLN
ncbi:hypothetical protein [Lactobacillus sp.]|uniref:hypothetical protein n=1 Tax=Lactobacillus sp. TaxID=1591 RepID=UPI0019CAAC03|nr:hypothetical protein [Lactobacillus sp.]MBD5430144.1 hypothetical protein [Lactobacillus sp.]